MVFNQKDKLLISIQTLNCQLIYKNILNSDYNPRENFYKIVFIWK